MKRSSLRSFTWAGVVAVVVLAPASYTGAGDPPRKVAICHKGQTIEVAEPAVEAHLKHGDTLGPCAITPGQNR